MRRCINAAFLPLVGKFRSRSLILRAATVKEESLRVRGDWLEDSPVSMGVTRQVLQLRPVQGILLVI